MNSFSHSGEFGDLIYGLPTIKALGGGVLYLSNSERCRDRMTPERVDFICPLLRYQSYISEVHEYRGQAVRYNMDYFREYWAKNVVNSYGTSLGAWQCKAFDVDVSVLNDTWLLAQVQEVAPVVIHRSARYHNDHFPWKRVVEKYGKQSVFIGLKDEHETFVDKFGFIPYFEVRDALEMASVIAGAKLFIGNQSFPASIAEALKKSLIMEVHMVDPNCIYERSNAQYVFTRNIYLPTL